MVMRCECFVTAAADWWRMFFRPTAPYTHRRGRRGANVKLIGTLAAALLAAMPAFADDVKAPTTIPALDQRLAQMFHDGKIPGASVAIIEGGKVVFAKGYGYADVAKKIPATADTPFRAGSISKSLTSIAIMTLVEQHKLSLDDKLADFAPE